MRYTYYIYTEITLIYHTHKKRSMYYIHKYDVSKVLMVIRKCTDPFQNFTSQTSTT